MMEELEGGMISKMRVFFNIYLDDFDIWRFVYDNIVNLILMVIMENIVGGIIIDKFADLREKENIKNRDIEEVCFICGHQRETFEKKTDKKEGFLFHIKKDHYMWNYIFYLAYLIDKEKTEYTGIESYVNEKFQNTDLSWFPFMRALSLNNQEEDDEKTLALKYSSIGQNVK